MLLAKGLLNVFPMPCFYSKKLQHLVYVVKIHVVIPCRYHNLLCKLEQIVQAKW